MAKHVLHIGLVGIGLEAYWNQFDGLKERLEGYVRRVRDKVARDGVVVDDLGLVDSPEKALQAGHDLRRRDIDLLLIHVTTYALSSTVLPLVQRTRVPVLILNLTPHPAIDYAAFSQLKDRTSMTGEWLAYCSPCPVPEISNVFQRGGIPFNQVTGVIDGDPECWKEIDAWIDSARVAFGMAHNRLGIMGHYYGGMLDVYTDLTLQCTTFGGHIEMIEVDELSSMGRSVKEPEISQRASYFADVFDIQPDCPPEDLLKAARTSLALDRLVDKHNLGSLAYYYKGSGISENEQSLSSIILGTSLLTARGIPVAGELEVKNVQAMKILDLFGVGGSFTEYYALDLKEDVVLMGHDGPGHIAISNGKTKVSPLREYHGKVGRGLSVEMSVKHGPVTLLSVVESRDRKLMLLVAHAETVAGPILEIGNTNSRYSFTIGARQFVNAWNAEGPAHHCAVGIGHIADSITKLGQLIGVPVKRIC